MVPATGSRKTLGAVQVTGKFTLDRDGHPTKLTECTLIEPLDLSPIILNDVTYEERRFRFGTKRVFGVHQEPEEKQYLIVEDPKLEMLVYGRTRDDLIDEIGAHIGHLWGEFPSIHRGSPSKCGALLLGVSWCKACGSGGRSEHTGNLERQL